MLTKTFKIYKYINCIYYCHQLIQGRIGPPGYREISRWAGVCDDGGRKYVSISAVLKLCSLDTKLNQNIII